MRSGLVKRSERMCSFFWTQRMAGDDAKRVLLFDSYQAAQSLEKCRKP